MTDDDTLNERRGAAGQALAGLVLVMWGAIAIRIGTRREMRLELEHEQALRAERNKRWDEEREEAEREHRERFVEDVAAGVRKGMLD